MTDRRCPVSALPVHYGGLVHANEQRNLGLLQTSIQPFFPDMVADRFGLPRISFIYGLFRLSLRWQKGNATVPLRDG
jgi:hypothetical protein